MNEYTIGQRWISHAEPDLGLGIVLSVEDRTVQIAFPESDTLRHYNRKQAPLNRVRFTAGDQVLDNSGQAYQVVEVIEDEGLLYYQVQTVDTESEAEYRDSSPTLLCEAKLHGQARLNTPFSRLLSGQLDDSRWFQLRAETLKHQAGLLSADLRGLAGGRIGLIPHQLYIAQEVAQRFAPRVLLADEVGLGKTIEAGMILHHQLLSQRARRAMVLVPEHLLHQWLVEMLRRFNLSFTLLDEPRCQAIESSGEADNPFEAQQLVLCALEWLCDSPRRQQQALAAEWDLLIIDEAHHLGWTPDSVSEEYRLAEALSARTRGLLLLSATPEQLGVASHFARLRLLDPQRFNDLDSFLEEQQGYQHMAELTEQLLNGQELTQAAQDELHQLLPDLFDPRLEALTVEKQRACIRALIDRHGTGRILFRNTRQRIGGFPVREVHLSPLPLPNHYSPKELYPETQTNDEAPWWRDDPRIDWLWETLKSLRGEKVLLLCAHDETALELAEGLRVRFGLQAALFHSGLSLVACDRAAAFFAEDEGTQLLISSEIGSEGRNFQFARHLVLFDLPASPDRLEQRIGRLDRIGQGDRIHLHLPYFTGSAQELWLRWYHEGLDALAHTCGCGQRLYQLFQAELNQQAQALPASDALATLLDSTRNTRLQFEAELQRGRDRLLELNSFDETRAHQLIEAIEDYESEQDLRAYLEALLDGYAVEVEEHSAHCLIVRPGAHQLVPHFPALPDDGCTLSFDRDTALSREEMQFVTWEHPMVTGAMELLLEDGRGSAMAGAIKHPALSRGQLVLEALFVPDCPAPPALQLNRFLSAAPLRVLIGDGGAPIAPAQNQAAWERAILPLEKPITQALVEGKRTQIERLLGAAEQHAAGRLAERLSQAARAYEAELGGELARLEALRQHNPNIRREEIDDLEQRLQAGRELIPKATLRLEAIRVLLAL